MRNKFFLLLILWWMGNRVWAQDIKSSQDNWDDILETVLSLQNDNADREGIYNTLLHLHENPVDLNHAGRDDFEELFFLTRSQIDTLLYFRSQHGFFLSSEELNYVPGMDAHTIRLLLPFIVIRPEDGYKKVGIRKWISASRKSFLTKFFRYVEKPGGYNSGKTESGRYLGNPLRIMNQVKLSIPNEFSAGLCMEKDPGEALVWSPRRNYFGFDHYSFHFTVLNTGCIRNFTIGDYKLQYGQGLVLGNGFYLGKSAEPIASIDNKASAIRPYCGPGESGNFHGAALELKNGPFVFTGFFSDQKADARIDTGNENNEIYVRSILTTGLHRSLNEMTKRKNLRATATGSHVNYSNERKNLSLGVSAVYTRYQYLYREDPTFYNQFDFTGKDLLTAGFDYRYYHRKFSIFGEEALSDNQKWGLVNGIIGNLSENVEVALSIRYYSPGFHSFYGNPLREASNIGNESGIYWGLKIVPLKRTEIGIYFDSFRFPWLKYNIRSPGSGNELFMKLTWDPFRNVECYGQFRQKIMDASVHFYPAGIDSPEPGLKRQFWFQIDLNPDQGIQLKSRFQFSRYRINGNNTWGMAVFQDLGWKFNSLSIHSRVSLFLTEDYSNRQYMFEQGALYDFEVPEYNGKGLKFYILLNEKIGRRFHLWLKTGRVIYDHVSSVGTGTETISGNRKTDVLLQGEWNF